jgi:hypothetical protein
LTVDEMFRVCRTGPCASFACNVLDRYSAVVKRPPVMDEVDACASLALSVIMNTSTKVKKRSREALMDVLESLDCDVISDNACTILTRKYGRVDTCMLNQATRAHVTCQDIVDTYDVLMIELMKSRVLTTKF